MELTLKIVCLLGCCLACATIPRIRIGYDILNVRELNIGIIIHFITGAMISAYPIFY